MVGVRGKRRKVYGRRGPLASNGESETCAARARVPSGFLLGWLDEFAWQLEMVFLVRLRLGPSGVIDPGLAVMPQESFDHAVFERVKTDDG